MRRDQEFLSKNQFLTFKSKHHQKTFGIYSFSSIHSYKSIVFCHWCTTYTYHIILYHIVSYHSYHSVLSGSSRPSLSNKSLFTADWSPSGPPWPSSRTPSQCSPGWEAPLRLQDKHHHEIFSNWWTIFYLTGRAVWLLGLRTVGCTSRDETLVGRHLCRHRPCPPQDRPTWTSR